MSTNGSGDGGLYSVRHAVCIGMLAVLASGVSCPVAECRPDSPYLVADFEGPGATRQFSARRSSANVVSDEGDSDGHVLEWIVKRGTSSTLFFKSVPKDIRKYRSVGLRVRARPPRSWPPAAPGGPSGHREARPPPRVAPHPCGRAHARGCPRERHLPAAGALEHRHDRALSGPHPAAGGDRGNATAGVESLSR